MKKAALLLLLQLSAVWLRAQDFDWVNTTGSMSNIHHFVRADGNGYVYAAGLFVGTIDMDPGPGTYTLASEAGSADIYLLKMDAAGTLIWAKSMGGSSYDYPLSLALDKSGNVHMHGTFSQTVDFDPGPGSYTLSPTGQESTFIAKYDTSGSLLWVNKLAKQSPVIGFLGGSLAIDTTGNVYMAGGFFNTEDFDPGPATYTLSSAGSLDMFLCKFDPAGSFLWAKSMGGVFLDYFTGIALDASDNIYATGHFNYIVDFDPGPGTYTLDADGNSGNAFVAKYTSSGNVVWARCFKGDPNGPADQSAGSAVAVDALGSTYCTGYFSGVQDFDPGPATYTLASTNVNWEIYLVKLDPLGNFAWAKGFGSTGMDEGFDITLDAAGDPCLVGVFWDTVDFDPGPAICSLSAAGGSEAFIAKFDAGGNFAWVRTVGGPANDQAHALSLGTQAEIYIAGFFNGTADFDPGSGTYLKTATGYSDRYLLKLGPGWVGIHEAGVPEGLRIYPNPVERSATIRTDQPLPGQQYVIVDQAGKICSQGWLGAASRNIDMSGLPPGLYFVKTDSWAVKLLKK